MLKVCPVVVFEKSEVIPGQTLTTKHSWRS
jgi:hypothetical protein